MKSKFLNRNLWCSLALVLSGVTTASYAQTDSVDDLINGRFAGVHVLSNDGAPGSAFSVRIRGLRSFRGDSQPLYVLDGVILNSPMTDVVKTFWRDSQDYQALQSTLDNINPEDIADIQILKDGAATAIYGSLGANGVVIITTKKGQKDGMQVNWNSQMAVNEAARISHKHHVSVSGDANRKGTYYVSAGYRNTNGTIDRSSLDLVTVNAKYEHLFGKTSRFGTSLMVGMRDNAMVMATSPLGTSSTVKSAWAVSPLPEEGPGVWTEAYDDDSKQYSIMPNLYVDAGLGAGFRFNANAGLDFRNKTRMRWVGSDLQRASELEGLAGQSSGNIIRYNADASVAYGLDKNGHKVNARAGSQVFGNIFNQYVYEGYKFFNQSLRAQGISLAENVAPYRYIQYDDVNVAVFLTAEYSYNGRYFIGGSIRTEMDAQYEKSLDLSVLYPSVYAGWNIAAEPFMKSQDVVSNLKFTVGWGKSGVSQKLPYGYESDYITGVPREFYTEGLTNYFDMRWRNMSSQYNASLDFGFLEDRIMANVNVYQSVSDDNLSYYKHTPKTPYENVYANSASVLNKGIEFSISADIIRDGDFTWNAGGNFSYNHNEILSTGAEGDVIGNSVGVWDGKDIITNINRKGESVGSFYGYMSQGSVTPDHTLLTPSFFGTRLYEGDVKFIDQTGDGNVTEEDMTVIGNSLPKYLASFNTTLTWKGISLFAAFDGAFGYQVANLQKFYSDSNFDMKKAKGLDVFSSRHLEDASYVRLSDLTLSYRFDVAKVKWMDSVGVSLSAKNLCVFSRYSAGAPYVNSYGYDLSRLGVDNGAYPPYSSFLLALNVRF